MDESIDLIIADPPYF